MVFWSGWGGEEWDVPEDQHTEGGCEELWGPGEGAGPPPRTGSGQPGSEQIHSRADEVRLLPNYYTEFEFSWANYHVYSSNMQDLGDDILRIIKLL